MTSVALVVLDTLRKDAFDRHFDWLPGKRFERAFSPSHWTVPVHGSLFTGLYPSEHGATARNREFDTEEAVLAERLRSAGYRTRFWSANSQAGPAFGFDRGFSEVSGTTANLVAARKVFDWSAFVDAHIDDGLGRYPRAIWEVLRSDCKTLPSLWAGAELKTSTLDYLSPSDSGAAKAFEWVSRKRFDGDEFVFLNLMEAHAPYDEIPKKYQVAGEVPREAGLSTSISGDKADVTRRAYDAAVKYLSRQYRVIFGELARSMDWIITVGDHGELLGEHGFWGHEFGLFEQLTHVPLVVWNGESVVKRCETVVNLLDVHQTILEVTKVGDGSRGNSLVRPEATSRLIEADGLPNDRKRRLRDAGVSVNKYDVELSGLVSEEGEVSIETGDGWEGSEASRREMRRLRSERSVADSVGEEGGVSKGVEEQLRRLGYAD